MEDYVKALEITCGELRALQQSNDVTRDELLQRREQVETLQAELSRCTVAYEKLQEKTKRMVETPLGFRQRVHQGKLKNLDELKAGSGHFKRRRTHIRASIHPSHQGIQCR